MYAMLKTLGRNKERHLPVIALNDLPARKRWKREIFQRRGGRRQRQARPVVSVVQQDAELANLERQHTGLLELITELDGQRKKLQEEADKVLKRIARRKKALAK